MDLEKTNDLSKLYFKYPKNSLLCKQGENNFDLFIIISGKLLICSNKGSQVTPLAYIGATEYFGELSFFDHKPRSANAITLEETTVIRIPQDELNKSCPDWLVTIVSKIINKLRTMDELISIKGIRRKNVETIPPLSIEEQSRLYKIISST